MSLKRVTVVVVVAVLVVTAGCSGVGDSADADAASDGDGASADDPEATGSDAAAKSDDERAESRAFATERMRIRSGEVHLRVESYADARESVVAAADRRDGFVSDSSRKRHERDNATWVTGTVVIRVPAAGFDGAMDDVRDAGEVQSSSTSAADVTEVVADIDARLENLRSQRDRLRGLYEAANETEDVLRVQSELSEVQSEIERLEAKRRTLEDRVAYSTIEVRVEEPRPAPRPGSETDRLAWYDVPLAEAFLASVEGVVATLRAIAVAAAYVVPYALTFGVPLAAAAVAVRRRR